MNNEYLSDYKCKFCNKNMYGDTATINPTIRCTSCIFTIPNISKTYFKYTIELYNGYEIESFILTDLRLCITYNSNDDSCAVLPYMIDKDCIIAISNEYLIIKTQGVDLNNTEFINKLKMCKAFQ